MTNDLSESDVMAGIVTYNPDLSRLIENVRSISDQVPRVLLFDNGSANAHEVMEALANNAKVRVLRNTSNVGIAAALNRLLLEAESEGFSLVLTLDQDSVATPGMVADLRDRFGPRVAMVTPTIADRNKENPRPAARPCDDFRLPASKGAITSGALLSVRAAGSVGGFDERYFIDYVDYDLNARLLLSGWRIVRSNTTTLIHEVGRAEQTWLLTPRKDLDGRWRLERFYSFGHDPFRCYYKARNRIIFTKKYGFSFGLTNEGIFQIPQQIILTLLFERNRVGKFMAFMRGIRDGLAQPVGRFRRS